MTAAFPNAAAGGRKRQSPEARRAETQEKLLDAAFRNLRDLGHAGLRSANVSRDAGVSRGGLLHHFPSKELLVEAVYRRIVETAEEESWRRIGATPDEALLPAIVADARSRFFSESYKVALDVLLSGGAPKEETQQARGAEGRPSTQAGWARRVAALGVDMRTAEQIASFLWNTVKGLAVRSVVQTDPELTERVIALSLQLAGRRLKAARRPV